MVEENRADQNSNEADSSENYAIPSYLRGVFIAGAWAVISLLLTTVFWPNLTERMKIFTSTLWIVVTTFAVIAQAVINRNQWQAMQAQSALIDKSIETANLDSIYANRAYVIAKIKDTGPYDEGFQFRLIIENGGNTPANNVCVHYWCDFGDPPWRMLPVEQTPPNTPIPQVIFDTIKGATTERLGVIGPRGSQVFTTMPPILVDLSIGSEASKQFDSGQARFYCWGTIVYEDIFNQSRLSHFCFSLWRKTAKGYVSFEQLEGYPCEHGNYAT